MLKTLGGGLCAGVLISIGGTVFLSCDNKYVGAVLFSVALVCICLKGYYLFTGKIGYITESHKRSDILNLITGLFGNAPACSLCALLIKITIPVVSVSAEVLCRGKLENQTFIATFIRAVFCGVLMYLAVSIFRDAKTPIGILFCVPVFILSGFEHSIADIFYFSVSSEFLSRSVIFIITVIFGNSVGGVLLPFISLLGNHNERKNSQKIS